jgi:hypothetical protein
MDCASFCIFGNWSVNIIAEALPTQRPRSAPASSRDLIYLRRVRAGFGGRVAKMLASLGQDYVTGARTKTRAPTSFSSCRICILMAAW